MPDKLNYLQHLLLTEEGNSPVRVLTKQTPCVFSFNYVVTQGGAPDELEGPKG